MATLVLECGGQDLMTKRSQRKAIWGHRITPQATLPAVGTGASMAAQTRRLTFTETRSLPVAARKTSSKHILKGMWL